MPLYSGSLASIDYAKLLRRSEPDACPALFLAPMENLADRPFRMAFMETLGGPDECCTEFLRVPAMKDHPQRVARGLAATYSGWELGDTPLGAQIMGTYLPVIDELVPRLIERGAPRIDFNCGCPASKVCGSLGVFHPDAPPACKDLILLLYRAGHWKRRRIQV